MAQRYLPLRPPPETWGTPPSPIPLWAQRGETAVSPLWKPLLGMGERQRKEKQRVSSLQPDKCLSPRCGDALRPSANFQRSRQEAFILAAVRTGRSFVWVSWPVSGQLIPDTFSFPPCTAHFLFGVSKRKWGVHSGRQSLHPCGGSPHPLWSTVPAEAEKMGIRSCMVSPCFPVPQSGTRVYDLVK